MSRQMCRSHDALQAIIEPCVSSPKWLEYGCSPGQDSFDNLALERVTTHWKAIASSILSLSLLRRVGRGDGAYRPRQEQG
eukprot:8583290-Pyramimonas_sp.AAC.1